MADPCIDPKSNDDFNTLIDAEHFREMDPGHTCVPVPDAPDSVTDGDYATLQIKYIADFDTPDNQTFYACADIKFVELDSFDIKIPCFNATGGDDEDGAGPDWNYHDGDEVDEGDGVVEEKPSSSSSPDSSKDEADNEKSSGGDSGMAGGTIAGVVVGCVAGTSLLAAAGLFIYRRKNQRINEIRKQNSSRGVGWRHEMDKTSV